MRFKDVAIFRFDVCLIKIEANRLAIQRHHQAHRGATGLGDLFESLLQLCKFSLSLLPRRHLLNSATWRSQPLAKPAEPTSATGPARAPPAGLKSSVCWLSRATSRFRRRIKIRYTSPRTKLSAIAITPRASANLP